MLAFLQQDMQDLKMFVFCRLGFVIFLEHLNISVEVTAGVILISP